MCSFKRTPKIQGSDSIVISAPAAQLWPLIQDSTQLEFWGPPVEKVDVRLSPRQNKEGKGSERKVYAKFNEKRKGWYEEVRLDEEEGKSVTFMVLKDSFGMGKMLEDVGAKMEIDPINADQVRFIFTFYHRPKNSLGWFMNPFIKADQKKNRLKALQSVKSYAETGIPIKN